MNLWIFLTYSFFGFVLEVVYARLTRSEKPDRKCLLVLPLCPVYGLAALGILALPKAVEAVPLLLFFAGGGVAALAEYAVGFFTRYAFGVDFWDYSMFKGNIHRLVCPLFALFWGALAAAAWYLPLAAAVLFFPLSMTYLLLLGFSVPCLLSHFYLRTVLRALPD